MGSMAGVVELADTADLKSAAVRRLGSNPGAGTNYKKEVDVVKCGLMHTDASVRGGPKLPRICGIGVYLREARTKEVIVQLSENIEECSSNEAEYLALIRGLEIALNLGFTHLEVRLDSRLILQQIQSQRYHVSLQHLSMKVQSLMLQFSSVHLVHIQRACNAVADELAFRATKEAIACPGY